MPRSIPRVRASRLLALLLHLQQRGHATADQLATELEVSVRTIYRDISALQAAGVPLWTETGPGGGVRLLDGWRTTLDGLTADEASALLMVGAPDALAELGLGAVLAAAQSKVLSTMPPELRTRAARVRQLFFLDAPGWFHHDEPTEHLATVADAVWEGHRLELRYGRRPQADDPGNRRLVDPLGLVLKAGVWYLVAAHRGQPRTYRVGRIHEARVVAGSVVRPPEFDLPSYWARSTAEFDRSMLTTTVVLRVDAGAARALPHVVDRRAAAEALAAAPDVDEEGWRRIELAVESVEVALSQLTALGAGVEALDPPELRAGLAEIGAAMARRNAAEPRASAARAVRP